MNFDLGSFGKLMGGWVVGHLIPIILIAVLTLVAVKVVSVLSTKIGNLLVGRKDDVEFQKRANTLSSLLRWALKVVIYVVAFMLLLKEFGVDVGPMIAAASVVGVAVGFGAQSLVGDFITGFFLLLEDQVRVGDVVQINDKGGLVEAINLRMVILRDVAGNVHFIRNSKIDVVTNMTKEFSRYVFDVGVAYREDPDQVIAVLKSIDEEIRQDPNFKADIVAPLEVMGVDRFADSAVMIKARITTKPIQQWKVGREFNRRIKKRFDELGIEIPFPHQTVYFGVDKKGLAPAAQVEIKNHA